MPRVLLTDGGTNFTSGLTAGIARRLGIRQRITSARRPQTDGLVERFNHTLASMIAKFTNDFETDWDKYLPLLLFAYRTTTQSSAGQTPFKLLYGREATQPLEVAVNSMPVTTARFNKKTEEYEEYVNDLQLRLNDVRERARIMVEAAQKRQSLRYNKGRRKEPFKEGDLVWIEESLLRGSKLKRMKERIRGPFRVVEQTSAVNYKLYDLETKRTFSEHADRIIPLHTRPQHLLLPPTNNKQTSILSITTPLLTSDDNHQVMLAGRSTLEEGVMWRHLRDTWLIGPQGLTA
jgi:hypothetical protein